VNRVVWLHWTGTLYHDLSVRVFLPSLLHLCSCKRRCSRWTTHFGGVWFKLCSLTNGKRGRRLNWSAGKRIESGICNTIMSNGEGSDRGGGAPASESMEESASPGVSAPASPDSMMYTSNKINERGLLFAGKEFGGKGLLPNTRPGWA